MATDYDFFERQLVRKFRREDYAEKLRILAEEYQNEEYEILLTSLEILRDESKAKTVIPLLGLKQLVVLLLPIMHVWFKADNLLEEIAARDPERRISKASLRVVLNRLVDDGVLEIARKGNAHMPTAYRLKRTAEEKRIEDERTRARAVELAIQAVEKEFGVKVKAEK